MVSLRSGTDTEDNEGIEATSSRRPYAAKHATKPQRTGADSDQPLAVLREEDSGSDEPGCDWPLARQILADLQELRARNGDTAPFEGSQAATEPLQQSYAGVWNSNGFKGWLDYHLGNTEEDGTGLCSEPPLRLGGEGDRASDDQLDKALPWHPVSRLVDGRAIMDAAEAHLQEDEHAAEQVSLGPRDKTRERRKELRQAPKTAGRDWYDLPATRIDDKVKRDLRLLRLRSAMDPKRFYKSPDSTKFPKFFQVGTVVAGPQEFYSGRMTKRNRKASITEELLADKALREQRKRRFGRLQAQRQQWAGRRGRKTSNARIKKHRKAPKH
ncbi:hypothetical protein WJX73_005964 [Symbiochloris irregularis]|uniref:Fcf2 pre-rRNA processing C-terminal domain-containing protein n=1 Tax=Symbiochloris irregularis TaxID=706552 RepID=A0AAW1NQ67_9CHLO